MRREEPKRTCSTVMKLHQVSINVVGHHTDQRSSGGKQSLGTFASVKYVLSPPAKLALNEYLIIPPLSTPRGEEKLTRLYYHRKIHLAVLSILCTERQGEQKHSVFSLKPKVGREYSCNPSTRTRRVHASSAPVRDGRQRLTDTSTHSTNPES